MRRLIAVVSLLTVANLVFVPGGLACPLTDGAHAEGATSSPAGHEAHGMSSGASSHANSEPERTHEPGCLSMGLCLVTIDLASTATGSAGVMHPDGVVAAAERRPPSMTSTPELPPPRA